MPPYVTISSPKNGDQPGTSFKIISWYQFDAQSKIKSCAARMDGTGGETCVESGVLTANSKAQRHPSGDINLTVPAGTEVLYKVTVDAPGPPQQGSDFQNDVKIKNGPPPVSGGGTAMFEKGGGFFTALKATFWGLFGWHLVFRSGPVDPAATAVTVDVFRYVFGQTGVTFEPVKSRMVFPAGGGWFAALWLWGDGETYYLLRLAAYDADANQIGGTFTVDDIGPL